MSYRTFRVQALIAAVLLSVASVAFAEDKIPQLDTNKPHLLPGYPDKARKEGKTGTTIVAIHVNELGKPFEVVTEKSSGSDELDQAAIRAVRGWRYLPAEADGQTVADWTAAGFQFDADGVKQVEVSPDTEVARAERGKLICRKAPEITGSHIDDKPTCMPKWQWEHLARQQKSKNYQNALKGSPMGGAGGSAK